MRFSFPHSHAFPGGEVRVEDAEAAEGMCVVEFGDGIAMIGEWHPDGRTFIFPFRPIARPAARMSMRAARGWSGTRLEPGVRGDPCDRTLRRPLPEMTKGARPFRGAPF
jgi:hypothetical protein